MKEGGGNVGQWMLMVGSGNGGGGGDGGGDGGWAKEKQREVVHWLAIDANQDRLDQWHYQTRALRKSFALDDFVGSVC
mgnify:CR=1 FL=1